VIKLLNHIKQLTIAYNYYKIWFSIIIVLFFTSALFPQGNRDNEIKKLMFKSKYSDVVSILNNKIGNGDTLQYGEKINLAISYQRLFNHDEAYKILAPLRKENPDNLEALFLIGESVRALGNNRYAIFVYSEIYKRDSSNVFAKIELGKFYTELHNYENAKIIYQSLIAEDSSNTYYLRQLGYTYYKLNAYKEAEIYFKKTLKNREHDSRAALWLAKIYFDEENYENAKEVVKKSAKFNNFDLHLNKLYAEILFKMKMYKSASAQYLNVIVLGDSSSVIFQKLGLSLYSSVATRDSLEENKKEETLREAIDALAKSMENESFQNPLTLTYLGFCHKSLKEYDESILYLEKALNAMVPEYIDRVYSTLGASYELTDKYPEAIKSYSKSLKYSYTDSQTIFRLATLYDRYYADKTVAVAHYKKYLKMMGDDEDILTKYSKERIVSLKEYIHFRN
jgi:tetratricopeptide (TPR) repeat protein